jgi:hypothetical protein
MFEIEATFELKVAKLEPSQPKKPVNPFCWLFPSQTGRGVGNRAKQSVGMEKRNRQSRSIWFKRQGQILFRNLVRFIKVIIYWILNFLVFKYGSVKNTYRLISLFETFLFYTEYVRYRLIQSLIKKLIFFVGLDHNLAYYQAFVYIRQQAIHLRQA